jgi:hypothetical protein
MVETGKRMREDKFKNLLFNREEFINGYRTNEDEKETSLLRIIT